MQGNTMQYNKMQYKIMQYNTMQCSAINIIQVMQCNTLNCNAVQCNTKQCSKYNTNQFNAIQYKLLMTSSLQSSAMCTQQWKTLRTRDRRGRGAFSIWSQRLQMCELESSKGMDHLLRMSACQRAWMLPRNNKLCNRCWSIYRVAGREKGWYRGWKCSVDEVCQLGTDFCVKWTDYF